MTFRRRVRRRLLWAGVLLGLVLVLGAVSVIRLGVWARGSITGQDWDSARDWSVARQVPQGDHCGRETTNEGTDSSRWFASTED